MSCNTFVVNICEEKKIWDLMKHNQSLLALTIVKNLFSNQTCIYFYFESGWKWDVAFYSWYNYLSQITKYRLQRQGKRVKTIELNIVEK